MGKKTKDVGNTVVPLKLFINEKGKQSSLSLLIEEKAFDKRKIIINLAYAKDKTPVSNI